VIPPRNAPTTPTADLASAPAPPDARLTALCHEYESLRNQLADLDQRKGEIETQLHGLEGAIASLRAGQSASPAPAAASADAAPSLCDLIDAMVRAAGGSEVASNAVSRASRLCRSALPLRRWLGHLASSSRLFWVGTALGLVVLVVMIFWLIS
jgi:hypothetical protein